MCFYDVSTGQEQTDWSGSYVNEAEAQFVSLLLAVVMARGLQAHSVGVITLYKAQARRIIDILRNYGYITHTHTHTHYKAQACRIIDILRNYG